MPPCARVRALNCTTMAAFCRPPLGACHILLLLIALFCGLAAQATAHRPGRAATSQPPPAEQQEPVPWSGYGPPINDKQLSVLANMLGIATFLLIVALHYVDAPMPSPAMPAESEDEDEDAAVADNDGKDDEDAAVDAFFS